MMHAFECQALCFRDNDIWSFKNMHCFDMIPRQDVQNQCNWQHSTIDWQPWLQTQMTDKCKAAVDSVKCGHESLLESKEFLKWDQSPNWWNVSERKNKLLMCKLCLWFFKSVTLFLRRGEQVFKRHLKLRIHCKPGNSSIRDRAHWMWHLFDWFQHTDDIIDSENQRQSQISWDICSFSSSQIFCKLFETDECFAVDCAPRSFCHCQLHLFLGCQNIPNGPSDQNTLSQSLRQDAFKSTNMTDCCPSSRLFLPLLKPTRSWPKGWNQRHKG